jgi:hypothetical protein
MLVMLNRTCGRGGACLARLARPQLWLLTLGFLCRVALGANEAKSTAEYAAEMKTQLFQKILPYWYDMGLIANMEVTCFRMTRPTRHRLRRRNRW